MQLNPRYDGPAIIELPDVQSSPLVPLARQRRRLAATLATLDDDQWQAASRCDAWTVRDVVAHVADVNAFWALSLGAGRAGAPTRFLGGFDPAATPAQMVAASSASHDEVLERYVTSTESFVTLAEALNDDEWSRPAECPPGHLPISMLAAHALWDAWVHERDIVLPLGLPCALEDDELATSLVYATALSPALGMCVGLEPTGSFAVETSAPATAFTVHIDANVRVSNGVDGDAPCLRGAAADVLEAVSLRAPLPDDAPEGWRALLAGLTSAFDAA